MRRPDAPIRNVYLWDASTGESTIISTLPDGSPVYEASGLMTPDGNTVLMHSTTDLTGGSRTGDNIYRWSRSDESIEFVAAGQLEGTSNNGDYLLAADVGENLRRVTTDTGTTVPVAVTPSGPPGNDRSWGGGFAGGAVISSDGRWVVFNSDASNLVPGDSNGIRDVFLRDMSTGSTTLLSTPATQRNADRMWSIHPQISDDGQFVAFESWGFSCNQPTCGIVTINRATGSTRWLGLGTTSSFQMSSDGNVITFLTGVYTDPPGYVRSWSR